jgi:hypothetical protein
MGAITAAVDAVVAAMNTVIFGNFAANMIV